MRSPVRPASRAPLLRVLSIAVVCAAALALSPSAGAAGPPVEPDGATWVADLSVQAFARDGQTLYLGGDFTRLSPRTGAAITLDGSDARVPTPEINGDVEDSVRDTDGGFYIAGSFTAVGGVARPGVAHLRPDGSLDPSFNPPAITGTINAVALSSNALYIGGTVSGVGGTFRNNMAALNLTTGALLPFNQGVSGFSDVISALVVSGTTLYVGGSFTDSSGNNGIGMLAAYDTAAGGGVGAIKAGFAPEPNQTVTALLLDASTSTLYLGGGFSCLPDLNDNQGCEGGETVRRNIAAVDPTTGALKAAFDADVSLSGGFSSVQTIGRDTNALVFGGDFNCVGALNNNDNDCNDGGESARQNIVRVNLTTGAPDGWQPNANDTVRALHKFNSSWWIGGDFTTISGQPRDHLARVSEDNAAVADALDIAPDGPVYTITRRVDPVRMFIGGDFRGAGGVKRAGLAAIDLQTGQPTPWAPAVAPNGTVKALATDGTSVYVGGIFPTLGGQPRTNLGAVDAASGAVRGWAPQPNGSVDALATQDGSVYAGGSFAQVGVTPNTGHLAKIDAATGAPQAGFPTVGSGVNALAIQDQTLYVGGGFGQIGGQIRSNAGAVNLQTGAVTGWDPHPNSTIFALAATPDRVFLGGNFTFMNNNASARNAVAAVNPTGGTVIPGWDAQSQSGQTNTLSVDGDDLYVGSNSFTVYGATPTRGLVRLGTANGALRADWIPEFSSPINAVSAFNGTVAAGGYFETVATTGQAGLATFTSTAQNLTGPVISGNPTFGSVLNCSSGTWNGNPLLTRAWLRGGTPIPGATGGTYTPAAEDAGQAITCVVTGSNLRGSASATSAAVDVPVVPVVPVDKPRVTVAAVLGRTVRKTSVADTVDVTYPSNVTLRGTTSTELGLPEAKVALTTSRRFESSTVSSPLGTLTSDAKGAFSLLVKKPVRNARYTATSASGSASVLVRVAPDLRSKTKKTQRGGKVTLAGTIRLPTLKKAGSLQVERKAGKAYKKVKTISSFTRGRFSVKTAQKKGTTTYRVRFVPRSAKTYTGATLTIRVKRS